jgi:hypothetical protein
LLLLGLLPGSVLATPPSNLDQKNLPGDYIHGEGCDDGVAQTFTAGKTGMLVDVQLDLARYFEGPATVDIYATNSSTGLPSGASLASSTATVPTGTSGEPNWIDFPFSPPLSVTAGTKYAIVIAPDRFLGWLGSIDTYKHGEAYSGAGSSWTALSATADDLSDLGFETFVDTAAPLLTWSKTSIPEGASTPLTLTETVTFKNGSEAGRYDALLTSALPAWFKPTGITCSDTAANIALADCTIAQFKSGFGNTIDTSLAGDVVTIELTGTANPAAAGSASVSAEGCIRYMVAGDQPDGSCASTAARITVTAPTPTPTPTAAPTPLPNSTGAASPSDGSGLLLWFLPIGLIAAIGVCSLWRLGRAAGWHDVLAQLNYGVARSSSRPRFDSTAWSRRRRADGRDASRPLSRISSPVASSRPRPRPGPRAGHSRGSYLSSSGIRDERWGHGRLAGMPAVRSDSQN